MKKKILIVSSSFHPEQSPRSFRATELAKEFSRKEHDVHVLTPLNNDALMLAKEYSFTIHDLGKNPFIYLNFKTKYRIMYFIHRLMFRSLNLLFEFPDLGYYFLVKSKLLNFSNFDLLISNAVPFPVHWGVASIWKNNKAAKLWVADCGDPYMGATSDTFPKAFYFSYFENKFLSLANYISIPFDDLKYKFNLKYLNKFVTIPQGFNIDNVNLKEYKKNDYLRIAYVGTVMPGHRHPAELIKYLLSKKVKFEFHFYGTHKEVFAKEYPIISSIKFFNKIDRTNLLYELSGYDFLVNVMEKKKFGKITAIPSKLIDYRLSGRPILNYEYDSIDLEIVNQFINGNYINQFFDENFNRFDIKDVTDKFLFLCK